MPKGKRSIYSIYNAISAIGLTLVNGLLGIVVTHYVILAYGSDFNGLNSTVNQIVNMMLVLEGGFTLASSVALFSPIASDEQELINGILVATRVKFRKIGAIFCGVGIVMALIYAMLVNSELPVEFIATIVIMAVVPQAVNLYFTATYRVLLQAQQREYIISLSTMLTVGIGHIANIIIISVGGAMWTIRFTTMLCSLVNCIFLVCYVRKTNKFISFNVRPRQDMIIGTKDVMVQRITGVIYGAVPIVFLSVSPIGGTILASVYAVYNSIFVMLKSLLHGIIDAPRLGIGQMLSEKSRDEVWESFKQYEYISFVFVFVLLTTAYILTLPFIEIYTLGMSDACYYDKWIAILMVVITVVEMLHIPSGHVINMAARFEISKKFQVIACGVLLVTMAVGGTIWGIYGMLIAILLTALVLAFLEMRYIHCIFFGKHVKELLKMLFPLLCCSIILCWVEKMFILNIDGYISFLIYGVVFVVINSTLIILTSCLCSYDIMKPLFQRVCSLMKKNKIGGSKLN